MLHKAAYKRTQQLPTLLAQQCWELLRARWQWCANGCSNLQQCWDLQFIVGRILPISLCKPCVMSVRGPNNVGRAVQTDPTLLRYASAITEQKKCWELLAEKFDRFILYATTSNNMQQGVQTDATCNIQKCSELLANNVGSVCTGLNIHFRVIQVLKEKHSMTFSHFQITFQPAGIYISPVILGNRRAKAHLLPCEQRLFDLPR